MKVKPENPHRYLPWETTRILQMGPVHRKLSLGRNDTRAAETHRGGRRRPDQRSTKTALA